uniref:KAP family P-loop NTPase fold protein n=1 Tax=Hafnia alvei TaxID=569 RepID=UPI0026EB3CB2|nr:P-loop NTPase fold protein [Hafnia alvei]
MRMTAPVRNFTDGFSDNDDIFNRKKLHDIIIRVASNAPDKSLVLALDDKWGNGKTSFVKMMSSEVKLNHSEQFEVIYFDAFESDYQSDPFVALTSKIYSLVEKENGKLKNLGQELLSIGKKLGASFALNGVKFAVSTLTSGLVSGSTLEKAGDAISNSLSSPIEDYIEEKIKTSDNELATIEQFGALLTKIHKESGKKIIFVIDELDRARPDFALDLLEKIKHIFSVEGFIFLLVINRNQFEKSIECRYGNINSRLYLNKFIHYWFTLPKVSYLSNDCRMQYKHSTLTRYLVSLDEGNNILSRNSNLTKTLSYLLEVNGCSLREAERCYSVFAVMEGSRNINNYSVDLYKVSMGFMAFLKVHDQSLLDRIINKRVNTKEVFLELNISLKDTAEIPEIFLLNHALNYHFSTDEELREFRAKSNQQTIYDEIEGGYGRRVNFLEKMYENIEGFNIS